MTLRVLSSLYAGACVLLILLTPSLARAFIQEGQAHITQSPDKVASEGPAATMPALETSRILPEGRLGQGRGPEREPLREDTSAPVPEPGTITLASMGLLALGLARRKRRGTHLPTRFETS